MKYDIILGLDPSGNFHEGKGTTGWCIGNARDNRIIHGGSISARKYKQMEAYWEAHLSLIDTFKTKYKGRIVIVIEDYFLYKSRAESQINSKFETSKLIGVIQFYCFKQNIPYIMQPASDVKTRWTNDILLYKKYIKKNKRTYCLPQKTETLDRHCLDSIRHVVHFMNFKNKET